MAALKLDNTSMTHATPNIQSNYRQKWSPNQREQVSQVYRNNSCPACYHTTCNNKIKKKIKQIQFTLGLSPSR